MTLAETRQSILDSDEFVLQEISKLQYLYGLKTEIRFNDTRTCDGMGESVAEHIYGMQIAAQYFRPLEDTDDTWDITRINNMILWHDMDELETGDMLGYLKTDADRAREKAAAKVMLTAIPQSMQADATAALTEYGERQTPEARFVKAVDKIDCLIQVFGPDGKKAYHDAGTTLLQHNSITIPFIQDWPYMNRFMGVITNKMVENGYFHPEA